MKDGTLTICLPTLQADGSQISMQCEMRCVTLPNVSLLNEDTSMVNALCEAEFEHASL
jgi:hypothetical protein